MQIDESDEQPLNADLSTRESLESASNATRESALHAVKQSSLRISTDEGTENDESGEHANARDSIRERLQSASKVTLETNIPEKQQLLPNSAILPGTTTSAARPKCFTIEVHSKLTKNSSMIRKCKLPAATEMTSRAV
jgi:hypothetical protein